MIGNTEDLSSNKTVAFTLMNRSNNSSMEYKKGKNILSNSNVCLSFFWPTHERQVIIKGKCSLMSKIESDKYFYSRPRESQIGAVASNQSSEIPNRKYIEDKFNKLKKTKNKIERPDHWGGVIVTANSLEFWQGRQNRLHDRIFYELSLIHI